MQKLCDCIDKKIEEGYFQPCANFLNGFAKQIGKVLVWVVYILTAFLTATSFFVILPYEQIYKSSVLLCFVGIFGFYLLVNVMYHYYKARTIPPVASPGKEGDRYCNRCQFFKSDRTHHCSICEKCILGMDHHCIWINQCVGSHNHRHFFLFVAYLAVTAFVIMAIGTNTIWDHIFLDNSGTNFCNTELYMAPMQGWICQNGELGRNSVIFCYLLSVLLFLFATFLTLWNFYLISKGMTYIDYLRHSDLIAVNPNFKNPLDVGFRDNWKNFLGLRRNRTFVRHVLLPSNHAPILFDSYGRVEKFDIV